MSHRLSILAGEGDLVPEAVAAARAAGWPVQVLALVPRPDLADVVPVSLSKPLAIVMAMRGFRATHVCMAGGVRVSDRSREGLFAFLKGSGRGRRSAGDTGLSRLAGALELAAGARVVGIHELIPDLVAGEGLLAGPVPDADLRADAAGALATAREVGRLDLGQAVVCAGRRVVAAEDIAGTDALIARVAGFRDAGLVGDGRAPLVLAKAMKPDQPAYVDLPAIGPATVENARAAGIAAIAVEAGRALVIGAGRLRELAEEAGIAVLGMRLDDD